ncbi:conserved hypothetical protein [Cupriavidus necator]|uniref:PAAR domain-containing protein n=1 Tax=Cupriavidus necator TaxID=106590 RepID=A0A1K0IQL7_CUPNE|nr:conserved hypothetical protein [Cupriavidus necator]
MSQIVRIGDDNDHGGKVLTGSTTMKFGKRGVARKGDKVSCPLHGENVIIEGSEMFRDGGVPVALHGHQCACGCRLIASFPNANIG